MQVHTMAYNNCEYASAHDGSPGALAPGTPRTSESPKGGDMRRYVVLAAMLSLTPSRLMARQAPTMELSIEKQDALIKNYCVRCHNDVLLVGGMSLEHV